MMLNFIYPDWPAPANVHALSTTRQGGFSHAPYDSLNLGGRVGDDSEMVRQNRRLLQTAAALPSEPKWVRQTHSTRVLELELAGDYSEIEADGAYTTQANCVSVMLTADCLPILFCSQQGDEVAAAHAGWRGLCQGIIEQTVAKFTCPAEQILAWFGPAIGPTKFEVGAEVKAQFEAVDAQASAAFLLHNVAEQKYLADLYRLAQQRLQALGVRKIYGGRYCTYSDTARFFSYRRAAQTGRIASLIWLS